MGTAEQLERALAAHGDTLYRVAILAGGDERTAGRLLVVAIRALVVSWGEASPAAPPGESELLACLVAAARAHEARSSRGAARARPSWSFPRTPSRRSAPSWAPFPLQRLPLDQRLALGLHLLLGDDATRIARALGTDAPAARAALRDGGRALGPAVGLTLTDRTSGELCDAVRDALVDPVGGSRHGAAVRGHLAGCALCRSFDQSWGQIMQAVEGALRAALRERTLPPTLAVRLVALARPRRRRAALMARISAARLLLPALAVGALIAALVLPGFLREPVSVVERADEALVDPQVLLARALARHSTPPDRGGIWHGRFATQWYFGASTIAPLQADLWLDPRQPARHRIQIAHAAGGAPYELQIGNGRDRLYYALDATYAPVLYGDLPTRARQDSPALLAEQLGPAEQQRARDERLASGPWAIPPAYIRQAQAAADLRVLGRQRDGGRTVQILSFSGVSPLGLPPDAPGATAERVTVLLALDTNDGLLRSATELVGPTGAEQTSRVTWRLLAEEWIATSAQIDAAFSIERAWTGLGAFSEVGRHQSADLAMPLISARAVGDPARLLGSSRVPLWMPSVAPAGVDRALLLWSDGDARIGNPPQGLVYLGPGRRLVLAFNTYRPFPGEMERIGPWQVTVQASRGQRYTLFLNRPRDAGMPDSGGIDPTASVMVDAVGFTRDELTALVRSMRPFDLDSLAAQDALFVIPRTGDPAARTALIRVALRGSTFELGRASYTRAYQFVRQAPEQADARRDPYHLPPFGGWPAETILETWLAGGAANPTSYRVLRTLQGDELASSYSDSSSFWSYHAASQTASIVENRRTREAPLPYPVAVAMRLLGGSGGELTLEPLPSGGRLLRGIEPVASAASYGLNFRDPGFGEPFLFDLGPDTLITEMVIGPDDALDAVRVFAARGGARELVRTYEVLEQREMRLAEAPPRLLDGQPPAALYTGTMLEFPGGGNSSVYVGAVVPYSLTQSVALQPTELYVLPTERAALVQVEGGAPESEDHRFGQRVPIVPTDPLAGAVLARLAVRITYALPATPAAQPPSTFVLTQGPATTFGAFLRASSAVPWVWSEPARLVVAGQAVDVWVGEGEQSSYLIAELGATLLVAEVPRGSLEDLLPLFAELRVAAGP